MGLRAVSGARFLAPLAVLVPIGATPAAGLWALQSGAGLGFAVVLGGLAGTAAAGRYTFGARVSVATAFCTWLAAAFVALPLAYAVDINTSACGKTIAGSWGWIAVAGGIIVFVLAGGWAFRTYRPFWGVPLAFVLGLLAIVLLAAAAPGTPGVCET